MSDTDKLLLTVLEQKICQHYTKSHKNILKLVIKDNTQQPSLNSINVEDNTTKSSSSSEDFDLSGDTIISVSPDIKIHNSHNDIYNEKVNLMMQTPGVLQNRVNSIDNLIISPESNLDQKHNLTSLLLSYRNSIKIDSKCFEIMYYQKLKFTKRIKKCITIIGFSSLVMVVFGLSSANRSVILEVLAALISLILGLGGYKDHESLESQVEALSQCMDYTEKINKDINSFIYRSNHSIEALNVFLTSTDDKLENFDRTTRIPIPLLVKELVMDNIKIEKKKLENITNESHDHHKSLYKDKYNSRRQSMRNKF
jgi:hypothetical protein